MSLDQSITSVAALDWNGVIKFYDDHNFFGGLVALHTSTVALATIRRAGEQIEPKQLDALQEQCDNFKQTVKDLYAQFLKIYPETQSSCEHENPLFPFLLLDHSQQDIDFLKSNPLPNNPEFQRRFLDTSQSTMSQADPC